MTYTYTPRGVCSRKMTVELENGVIKSVNVEGGCNGNLQGISRVSTADPSPRPVRTRWPTRWRKLWPRRPKRHDYGDLFSASLSPDGYGGAL